MTKIGYDEIKPVGTPQGNMPPAIDSSLQGAPGSQPSKEPVKEDTPPKEQNNTAPASPQPAQPASTTSDTPDHKADLIGYDNQIALLKKAQKDYAKSNETEEQRKKREKREKAKRVIAAVGDGIRALSNLYFTSQYAPNMYNPDDSQLAKTDARQEKLKAEREADRDKYLNYSLRIGDLENDRARTVREMEAQAERLRLAREKAAREQEAHKWLSDLQPDKKREQTAKADAADSVSKTKKAEADNAEAMQKAKLNTEQQRGKTEQTKQEANRAGAIDRRASAAAHNRSNVSEFSAYDKQGREHKFRTKAAADDFAKRNGTFKAESKTDRTTTITPNRIDPKKQTTKTVVKTASGGGYPQNPKKKFSSFSIHK